MGLRSRRKGCAFELVVRDRILSAFKAVPALTVRRSSQAERAYESDLIIEGPHVPKHLGELWVECEHANKPNPSKKFEQGCRDALRYEERMELARVPVVCWRATGDRTIWLSTSLANVNYMFGGTSLPYFGSHLLVTTALDEALAALAKRSE